MSQINQDQTNLRGIPRMVWALGFVSLFMDISSEMIHSLLPVFLVSVLGATAISVGFIEGFAEAIALIAKTFSGVFSDWLGRRKILVFFGYALGTLTKPLFAIAPGVGLIFTARLIDRLGKGVRGAPRDALIADVCSPHHRGTAYGLRQSLDTIGAFLGPLLAMAIMIATQGHYRTVFWVAVIPGLISVFILLLAVKEPNTSYENPPQQFISFRKITAMGSSYWWVVICGSTFTLARFSEAFLILRADSVGLSAHFIPLLFVLMNLVYSLTAYPAGFLSDRIGRTGLMTSGLVVLFFSDLVLAAATFVWHVAVGTCLWGLHMGLTQGLLSAMVADTAPEELKGTAFGLFNLASGVAVLAASVIAGFLWNQYGAPATFLAGAALTALALVGFTLLRPGFNLQAKKPEL